MVKKVQSPNNLSAKLNFPTGGLHIDMGIPINYIFQLNQKSEMFSPISGWITAHHKICFIQMIILKLRKSKKINHVVQMYNIFISKPINNQTFRISALKNPKSKCFLKIYKILIEKNTLKIKHEQYSH